MIETQNREWGFWGALRSRYTGASEKSMQTAWVQAVKALTAVGYTEEEARTVLDSSLGRHMADQCRSPRSAGRVVRDLVVRWHRNIAETAGRDPSTDQRRHERIRETKEQLDRTTQLHRKAAIAYCRAVDAGAQKIIVRRDRELNRAALALVEAIREASKVLAPAPGSTH